MSRTIDQDQKRFNEIVRGKVRQNLRKYVTHGEMIGRKGREIVSIPVPNIEIPHFRHGEKGSGGVGQGEGEVGQPIGKGQQEGDGKGQAGDQPGGHIREVDITLDELAEMLGEALELPNIEPKGKDSLKARKDKYSSIRTTGPNSLRHFKRTYKRALKRQISTNEYNPTKPLIIPMREDERFKAWKTVMEPEANAAILYMMDVSGSMTDEQKEIVRIESFWIDTWLKRHYDGVQRRYVIHDAVAREVDEDTFYRTRESGGTRISSAYKAAAQIIERDFPASEWNIYCFQFSDGDNWGEDNLACLETLKEKLLPVCNLFCYGQVESPYGSGDFIRELRKVRPNWDNLLLSEIENKDAIYDSIREFLGTGK
jgi:sporulation protein YhbH